MIHGCPECGSPRKNHDCFESDPCYREECSLPAGHSGLHVPYGMPAER